MNVFGISNFSDPIDRQSLFLLYKDMVTSERVSAGLLEKWLSNGGVREGIIHCYTHQTFTQLFQWQLGGSLEHKILESYYSTGKTWDPQYGDCFLWLLKNHEAFSLETPNWTWEEKFDTWYAKNRPLLLGVEDQNIPLSELQPDSKRRALQFWMETDLGMPQFPGEATWVRYGFCTCQTKREQVRMISLYKTLLERCSLKEFWDAIRYSTMIALFDKYGFESERKTFRHFESVMDNSRALPSAWYLKSFVYDAKGNNLPSALRAVAIDYGFSNCENATDRTRLRQTYRAVFDENADELLLHEACLAGKIFDFCSPLFPRWASDEREYFQALMANPYPLIPPVPWAGLVAEEVRFCKERDKEIVSQRLAAEGSESVLFVLGDALEGRVLRKMGEANSYWLETDPRTFSNQNTGYVELSPEQSRRAHFVDPVNGNEWRILPLAPQGQT